MNLTRNFALARVGLGWFRLACAQSNPSQPGAAALHKLYFLFETTLIPLIFFPTAEQHQIRLLLRIELCSCKMQFKTRTRTEQSVAAGAAALHKLHFLFETTLMLL